MNNYSSAPDQDAPAPWYRQFWAWFVFAPLLLVVVASSYTVSVAFRNADDVVRDNYYKDGRMINQVIEQDVAARALGLQGDLEVDNSLGEIHLKLTAVEPLSDRILLLFGHPVNADKDLHLVMRKSGEGRYRADLEAPLQYRWYVRLLPLPAGTDSVPENIDELEQSAAWRLSGEIDFAKGSRVDFLTQ